MDIILTFLLYTFVSLVSVTLFTKSCKCKNKYIRIIEFALAIIIPSLLAAARGSIVGSDTSMYIEEYYFPGTVKIGSGFTRTFEFGYRTLRNCLAFLGLSHHYLFFVMEAATLLFLFLAIKEESKELDSRVAVFIYMFDAYFQSFNMLRQALAVAIMIYSYTQLVRNRYIKTLVLILVAGLFHKTAWIFSLVIVAKRIFNKKNGKTYLAVGVAGICLMLSSKKMTQKVGVFFLGEKAIWYTSVVNTQSKLWVYLLKITPIIVLLILCINNYYKTNKKVAFYSGLALAGYVLASYGNFVATDAQRIALYLSRLDAIVLGYAVMKPLYFNGKKYVKPRQIRYAIYCYFLLMYIYNYFYLGVSSIVPYSIY